MHRLCQPLGGVFDVDWTWACSRGCGVVGLCLHSWEVNLGTYVSVYA